MTNEINISNAIEYIKLIKWAGKNENIYKWL